MPFNACEKNHEGLIDLIRDVPTNHGRNDTITSPNQPGLPNFSHMWKTQEGLLVIYHIRCYQSWQLSMLTDSNPLFWSLEFTRRVSLHLIHPLDQHSGLFPISITKILQSTPPSCSKSYLWQLHTQKQLLMCPFILYRYDQSKMRQHFLDCMTFSIWACEMQCHEMARKQVVP